MSRHRRPRRWTTNPHEHLEATLRAAFGRHTTTPVDVDRRRCVMVMRCLDLHSNHDAAGRLRTAKLLSSVPWVRAPDRFVPRSGHASLERDFVDHLLRTVDYPLPEVLYHLVLRGQVWDETLRAVRVLARVGAGASLASLAPEGLVAPLSRRGFHALWTLQAEAQTWTGAARMAAVVAAGGSLALASTIATSFLRSPQQDEPFWAGVLAWMGQQAVPPEEVGALLHAAAASRLPPTGTVASALRAAAEWLQSTRAPPSGPLPEPPWSGAVLVANGATFSISALTTCESLVEEGLAMRHCVATYAERARSGAVSLWSVCRDGNRVLTVELTRDGAVVQVRGASNRLPSRDEVELLRAWTRSAGLSLRRGFAG